MACFSNPGLNRLAGRDPKREPNPNMGNLVTDFCHWNYLCLRKGLNGFGFWFTKSQRVGMSRGREKVVSWCMSLFLLCWLFSFFFFLPLSFLLLFGSSFLSYSSLRLTSIPPPSWLPFFPFIPLDLMRFFPSVPKALPTVFNFLWASFQDCPLTPWLPSYYLCSERACCITPHLQTKFLV